MKIAVVVFPDPIDVIYMKPFIPFAMQMWSMFLTGKKFSWF